MGLGAKFFGKAADYGEELAGIAKGRQAGRQAEGQANESFDRTRVLADQNRLNAARYNQGLPGQRAHDSVQGDILAGVQPVTGSGSGKDFHLSGGLSPALISGQSRALGQTMGAAASGNTGAGASMDPGRAALLEQLAGSYQPFKPEFTAATPLPQANALDDILTGAGYAGKLYGAYRGGS
jgi:hypothetical protein